MSKKNQNELLNKLLSGQGSIAEKTSIARNLDTDHLQNAVSHSEFAKIEWERRLNEKKWYEKPLGRTFLYIIFVVLGILVDRLWDLIF